MSPGEIVRTAFLAADGIVAVAALGVLANTALSVKRLAQRASALMPPGLAERLDRAPADIERLQSALSAGSLQLDRATVAVLSIMLSAAKVRNQLRLVAAAFGRLG